MLVAEAYKEPEFLPLSETYSMGAAGQELRNKEREEVGSALQHSVFWNTTFLLRRAQSKLCELSKVKSNWDSYGAPAPNELALENAIRVLDLMQPFDLAQVSIVPSAEGGIGFCFSKGERYADIESSNEGVILGVRYVGMEAPVLIEADGSDDSIRSALEQVREHIQY